MKMLSILLCFFTLMLGAFAQNSVSYLVEITDMAGDRGFDVLDKDGLDELKKQLGEEAAAFQMVVGEARQRWKKASNVKGAYPASIPKVRRCKIIGTGQAEKLEAKKERKEASLVKKAESEIEKQQQKLERIKDENRKAAEQEKIAAKLRQRATAILLAATLLKEKLGREVPFFGSEISTYGEPLEMSAEK